MKKKILKRIIITLIILLISWITLIFVDYIRFSKEEITEPSICISTDGHTNYGIGYCISYSRYNNNNSNDYITIYPPIERYSYKFQFKLFNTITISDYVLDNGMKLYEK